MDIRAWGELFGHEFTIWEIDAIRSLDGAWMRGIAEKPDGKRRKTTN